MKKTILAICLISMPILDAGESVYCLHGFMRSSRAMKPIQRKLTRAGYDVMNWKYPSRQKTIHEHADDLVVSLQEKAQYQSGVPIHFVTHSLGGIIVRYALCHPNCPEEAKQGRIVQLAPPNRGSSFGRFLGQFGLVRGILGDQSGMELMTVDDFSKSHFFPDTVEVLVIAGTAGWNPFIDGRCDGKVAVTETCLTTPHSHLTCFAGHPWIMIHPKVLYAVEAFITQGEEGFGY